MTWSHRSRWAAIAVLSAIAHTPALAQTELARETPHVWNVTPESAVISWFTQGDDAPGEVEYGQTEAYGQTVAATSRQWPLLASGGRLQQHYATLTGLQPATRYFYRIRAGGKTLTPTPGASNADFHILTAPRPGDSAAVSFLVMGDGGEGNKYQRAITYQMEQTPHEFLLHTGDVVYDNGTDAEWSLNYYPIYNKLIRNRPWFLSLGNHDYLGSSTLYVVDRRFASKGERLMNEQTYHAAERKDPNPLVFFPQKKGTAEAYFQNAFLPSGPGQERYYSFEWGPVHVFVLDTNRSQTRARPGDPQYQWLEENLARSTAPWKIVAFHHPMTSIGKPAYTYQAPELTSLRRDLHPLFEKHGVDVVFAGHDHTYQRTFPIVVDPDTGAISRDEERGITHIITGGGGAGVTARSIFPTPSWHTGVYHPRHHFLSVQADAEKLTITALADDNINIRGVSEKEGVGGPTETIDTVTIGRRIRK